MGKYWIIKQIWKMSNANQFITFMKERQPLERKKKEKKEKEGRKEGKKEKNDQFSFSIFVYC
jgi:hypothetical protein